MTKEDWQDLGTVEELAKKPLQPVTVGGTRLALVYRNGDFFALSGVCNHAGGPLGEGRLDGDYVVCPWHYWKFHCKTGEGEPGFEEDRVPIYSLKIEAGRVLVDLASRSKRQRKPHAPHPLARRPVREPGPVRLAGISTTAMTRGEARFSTSDALLEVALGHAAEQGCATRLIRLRDLSFRHCEGFYSKSAQACTWPCSITQMDPHDELTPVYDAFVHWADALIVATPIRWGAASSLYYKMAERMNCIQNQETIAGKHLLRNKVLSLIITGGQDNVQGVAGQLLTFFAELGCQFPQFPFIAHSRGWSAEDMENNVHYVRDSAELREGAKKLAERTLLMAHQMLEKPLAEEAFAPGGRKAHQLDVRAQI
jgi:nitrite reductase/ring-hydroxylating ferredoxin subunit/multimeric flavodoxin WrbA